MARWGPDIVSEGGLRELIGQGHQIRVVCLEPVVRKDGIFYGLWGIRCISIDGCIDRVLVAHRRYASDLDRPRTFSTLTGIVGFLYGLDLRLVSVPMEQGLQASLSLAHHGIAAS